MNHVGSSINLLIVRDGKILLMRRISQEWMDTKLQIPGGKVEEGESPLQAVLREAREELDLQIKPSDVRYLATVVVRDGNNEYLALQFELLAVEEFEFRIMEKHKCSELVWADIGDPPEDTINLFKSVIRQVLTNHQSYIEIGY